MNPLPTFLRFPARLRAGLAGLTGLVAAALLALPSSPALAHHRTPHGPYAVEILVDGRPVVQHKARGRTYIEALPEREYSIRLTNRTGVRVAVALSVDGLNTIDAASTTAREARKWILGPHQSITLDGWQTSSSTARRFFFTTEESSYGSWLGKTSNLGVISAAFFRERPRPPVVGWSGRDQAGSRAEREARAAGEDAAGKSRRKAAAHGPAAEGSLNESFRADDLAATGIGREKAHHVRRIAFEHEDHPASVVTLRYEFRNALISLGVLPRSVPPLGDDLHRRENARGFEDTGYAPDPYASKRR